MTLNLAAIPFGELLDAISAKTPAPGGGAAASIIAATAGSLIEMVVRFTEGRAKYQAHADLHAEALRAVSTLRAEALDLARLDIEAYAALNALMKLPEDDPERREHWDHSVEAAIAAPSRAMNLAGELLDWCERLLDKTNRMLRSDLAIAAITAEAALRAAAWNVYINLSLIEDHERRAALEADLERRSHAAGELVRRIEASCR